MNKPLRSMLKYEDWVQLQTPGVLKKTYQMTFDELVWAYDNAVDEARSKIDEQFDICLNLPYIDIPVYIKRGLVARDIVIVRFERSSEGWRFHSFEQCNTYNETKD